MSRGGALALVLVVVFVAFAVGCTEAPTIDPGDGSDASDASGGAPGAQMMFVPYHPAGADGTGNVGGLAGSVGAAAAAGAAAASGAAGMPGAGGGAAMGAAAGGLGSAGAAAPIPATMLGLLPVAISPDGAVVAGSDEGLGRDAMVWTSKRGPHPLPPLTPSHDRSEVSFINAAGTVFGFSTDSLTGERQGVAWASDTFLPFDPFGGSGGDCAFIPTAGSRLGFIAATCTHASGAKEAFAKFSGAPTALGFLPGDTDSEAVLMSADGATVVGYSYDLATKSQRAFRWTQAGGMAELPPYSHDALALPRAVSADGSMIAYDSWVGTPTFPGVAHPTVKVGLVWTKAGVKPLANCPPAAHDNRVVAIGAKSSAILGACLLATDATPPSELPLLAETLASMRPLVPPPPFKAVTPVGIGAATELVVGLGYPQTGPPAVVLWWLAAKAPTMRMASPTSPTAQPVDLSIAALCENASTLVGAREDADGSRHGWLIHR